MKKVIGFLLGLLLLAGIVFATIVVYEKTQRDPDATMAAANPGDAERSVTALSQQEFHAFQEDADGWATAEEYQHWKNAVFPIPEYDGIPTNYKRGMIKVFVDNKYVDPGTDTDVYRLTRIKDRAPNVFAYGNFSGRADGNDANRDIAYILESADFSDSQLFIQSSRGDLIFYKKYGDSLPTIQSFRKGDRIFMDKTVLEPAPEDGILLKDTNRKLVVMYDRASKSFKQYHQYTREELDEINSPDSHDPECGPTTEGEDC